MTLDQLITEVKRRRDAGESIDELRDDILELLLAYHNAPPPVRIFRSWIKRLGASAASAELGLKHLDVAAEDFETLASAARSLGKTRT